MAARRSESRAESARARLTTRRRRVAAKIAEGCVPVGIGAVLARPVDGDDGAREGLHTGEEAEPPVGDMRPDDSACQAGRVVARGTWHANTAVPARGECSR